MHVLVARYAHVVLLGSQSLCHLCLFGLSVTPMGRFNQRDRRIQIQALLRAGTSIADICRITGAARSTVSSLRNGHTAVNRARGSGRTPKLTKREQKKVLLHLGQQQIGSVRRGAASLRKSGIADVSKTTVHRIAQRFKWHSSKPYARSALTEEQKQKRLAFATATLNAHPSGDEWWQQIVFSDEKLFDLNGNSRRVWLPPGVNAPVQQKGVEFAGNYFARSFRSVRTVCDPISLVVHARTCLSCSFALKQRNFRRN